MESDEGEAPPHGSQGEGLTCRSQMEMKVYPTGIRQRWAPDPWESGGGGGLSYGGEKR